MTAASVSPQRLSQDVRLASLSRPSFATLTNHKQGDAIAALQLVASSCDRSAP
jgi:hypothetical protein